MGTWKIHFKGEILGEFDIDNIQKLLGTAHSNVKKIQGDKIYFIKKPMVICNYKGGIICTYHESTDWHSECKILWETEDHLVKRVLYRNFISIQNRI